MQLDREERADAVQRIQEHFRTERGEALGDLAAGLLLSFIADEIGPAFYNRGVRDATALAERTFGALSEELHVLEVLPKSRSARKAK
ncbi:MAG: DUF2164 family protein [Thermoplasmatota archaeon]